MSARSTHAVLLAVVIVLACGAASAQKQQSTPAQPAAHANTERTPIVIAHRGASGYIPEHTTESAAFAHALGADYIEQDAVLTKDGVPVVLHDLTLNDVTDVAQVFPKRARDDGRWYVMDFTLAELRQLIVHERDSPSRAWKNAGSRFPVEAGIFRIATLADHLRLIQGLNQSRRTDVGVYVEIKSPAQHRKHGLDASQAVLQVLHQAGYRDAGDRIFVQCFDEAEVRRLRTELDCQLPLIQLASQPPTREQIAAYAEVADGIGVRIEAVISGVTQTIEGPVPKLTDVVRLAHEHAMQVHVWTFRTDALPDVTENPGRLLEWLARDAGVDGVFTDQPDVVLDWRATAAHQVMRKGPFRLLNDRPETNSAPVESRREFQ